MDSIAASLLGGGMEFLEPSPFDLKDLIEDPKLLSIHHGPNGTVLFSVKKFDIKSQSGSFLFSQYDPSTDKIVQKTRTPSSSPFPCDNGMMYLKGGQIWQLADGAGEPQQVTKLPLSVDCFKLFSCAGQKWVALSMNVYASMTPAETVAKDAAIKATGSSGMVFDRLMVRHWDTWGCYEKRNHVFVGPLDMAADEVFYTLDASKLRDLMFGLETDCPGKAPGHGDGDFEVAPNGEHVAMAFRRTMADGSQNKDMAWSTDCSIFVSSVLDSSCRPWMASEESCFGNDTAPMWSPDSSKLAYLSMARAQYESDKLEVKINNIGTDKTIYSLTGDVDLSFGSIDWVDARTMYTTGQFRGSTRIFKLDLTAATALDNISMLVGDDSVGNPIFKENSKGKNIMYFLSSNLSSPNELKCVDVDTAGVFAPFKHFRNKISNRVQDGQVVAGPKEISSSLFVGRSLFCPCPQYTNGDLMLSQPTQHYFVGGGGDLVHAWYLPPVDLKEKLAAGQKIPLVWIIHGGPQGAIVNSWHYRWNMNIFASRGYAVATVNFHGSSGFGMDFMDSIRGDWGGKPFDDQLLGLDYFLHTFPYLDESRVAAMGASYGGYMINWLNGHTRRFKCLVNHDGIFSLRNQYFNTEELWFPEWEFGGTPWENEEVYRKHSPDTYVKDWSTPTLVIHGGLDYRVCETEGIATFTALQRKGVDSQLLFFPDENHWVLKALNSHKWHTTIFEWLSKYLNK